MTTNFIGATLYVAQALPATNDKAGFEALTWVQVKGIQTLPSFGVSHAGIDVEDLGTGFTSGVKGAGAGRDTSFTMRRIAADPGQIDAKEQADDQNGVASLKIGYGTGADAGDGPVLAVGDEVHYAQGYLHSYDPNQGSVSTSRGSTISFRQNAAEIEDVEPA